MFKVIRLTCSFCGKRDKDVRKLVAGPRFFFIGPRTYICDSCVHTAKRIMEQS